MVYWASWMCSFTFPSASVEKVVFEKVKSSYSTSGFGIGRAADFWGRYLLIYGSFEEMPIQKELNRKWVMKRKILTARRLSFGTFSPWSVRARILTRRLYWGAGFLRHQTYWQRNPFVVKRVPFLLRTLTTRERDATAFEVRITEFAFLVEMVEKLLDCSN